MDKNWKVNVAVRAGMGKVRSNNEDAFYLNGYYLGLDAMNAEASKQLSIPMEGSLFAVCDGIGGQSNGEIASFTAVSRMPELQRALRNRDFGVVLQRWVQETNKYVQQASTNGGCTLALVYFQDNAVRIAHIGDSRVYRFHDGILTQLTIDHTKVQMLVNAGVISRHEAKNHPQRHVITRYMGMPSESVVCEAALGRAMPTIDKDKYIICSDGVTDMLDDEKIRDLIADSENSEVCAESIYRAALESGGKDNTTVIVIELKGPEVRDPLFLSTDEEDEDDEPTIDDNITSDMRQSGVIDMSITSTILPDKTVHAKNLSIRIKVACN